MLLAAASGAGGKVGSTPTAAVSLSGGFPEAALLTDTHSVGDLQPLGERESWYGLTLVLS